MTKDYLARKILRPKEGELPEKEVKGGTTFVNPSRIVFTSNVAPQSWFPQATPSQKAAFFRRVTNIRHFIDKATVVAFQSLALKHRSNCFRYERIVRSMIAHQRRIIVEETGIVQPKEVVILFGNTGTGKTTAARAEASGAIYQVFNPGGLMALKTVITGPSCSTNLPDRCQSRDMRRLETWRWSLPMG